MEEEVTSQINSFKTFLENVNRGHSFENADEDFIQGTTLVTEDEFEAEVLDWALQYLLGSKCPSALAAALARNVLLEVKTVNLKEICHKNTEVSELLGYQPIDLWRIVVGKVHDICQQWQDAPKDDLRALVSRKETVSLCAIKNSRRTMEDRHVVIQDLNVLFGLQGHPITSFFAVFDGHAGTGAACYSAVHLHYNIIHHPSYPNDIKTAMKEGFTKTDKNFICKSNREGLKSGSTALCCLLRDKEMYMAWLGDSQAILVRDGAAVEMMKPHKPDREDERERIEKLGGCVVHFGTWRVNGTLAVSRAIGDAEYKPFVSSDPDVDVTRLDGTEDFIILACDGLWDVLQPNDVAKQVYSYLVQSDGDVDGVAAKLVQVAKEKGSGDNITVLAVFLRDVGRVIGDYLVQIPPLVPENVNPFANSLPDSFGSQFVNVEYEETALPDPIRALDDGQFPTANPTFEQEFLLGWGAANFSQQMEGGGFAEDLPSDRKSFSPFENPFGQYEQPESDNRFYAVTGAGKGFGYQAKAEEDNLVEFENNVTDWPDNAAGVELETNSFGVEKRYDDDALHQGLFDAIKPFQSNLSPDAEPFVMGSRVHAGDEFAQNVSHVPSQPLEAFIDAKPYTPFGHVEAEVLQSEEQIAYASPDLPVPGDTVPACDETPTSTEIPTAPPADGGLYVEEGTTNVPSGFESGRDETCQESKFEHDSQQGTPLEELQRHVTSVEVGDSEVLPFLTASPEPESESEGGIPDGMPPEDRQERPFKELVLRPDVPERESLHVLESLSSDDRQKRTVEDFVFGDAEQFGLPELRTLQNIGFEYDVLQSANSEGPRSASVEDFVPGGDLTNVTEQSPSELKIVQAAPDVVVSLPSEGGDGLAEPTEDREHVGERDLKFDRDQSEREDWESPAAEELVDVSEAKPDSSHAELEVAELGTERSNVAIEQDVAVKRAHPNEIGDVEYGSGDQQVPSSTVEALTNVETMVSEVRFDYLESPTGLSSEVLVSDVDLGSDSVPEFTLPKFDLDAKEAEAPSEGAAIPDTVPIADDVEDDESEDGEEWKFYRSDGADRKPVENVEMQPVEVPILNGHADAEMLALSLNLEDDVAAKAIDPNDFTESDSEVDTSFDELNVKSSKSLAASEIVSKTEEVSPPVETLEPEQVKSMPVDEPPKPAETPKELTKPRVPTTKTAAKATTKTIGNRASSTAASQKPALAAKLGISKPGEAQKRPAPKAAAPKTAPVASKSLAAAQKPSTTALKAAGAPSKKPVPAADATKKVLTARPKALPPTAKPEAATRVAPARPPLAAAKVSKEQSNVRNKVPAATNGATKDTTVAAKKLQSTAASVTSRLITKPSSAPVRDAIKKDVAKTTTATTTTSTTTVGRAASARVDVKQTKETVNKQILVVSKRVTTTATTKTGSVKLDANGTKGPVATSSPKTPLSAGGNKEVAEKKPSSGVKAAPKARTPIAKSSPNNAVTTRSPAPPKTKTPSKTPLVPVRERGTMPKSSSKVTAPGKPIRKSPAAPVTTITGNSPSKGKVEESTNEKGILDATSKENGTAENGVQNGVDHPLENGNGHGVEGEEHMEQQQGDADLVLV